MGIAIPKDSLILVTGINGFIGSHVADQLLKAGYRVRGTTRTIAKVQNLCAMWEKKFGAGRVEIATVPDMSKEGAAGVAHIASNLSFSSNPNDVIPEVLAGVRHVLESAAKQPSVKRFVYTSSSTAATAPKPNIEFKITTETWNQEDIDAAWAPPPYLEDRKCAVYGASKTQGEQEVWKFMKEKKPHFTANAVLPNANFGLILDKDQPAGTGAWVKEVYNGNYDPIKDIPPQWFVNVQDTARLHVAALIQSNVENERIFACAAPYTWNDIVRAIKKVKPAHNIQEFADDNVRDRMKLDNSRGEQLLKTFGRPGWTGLEDTVRDNIANL